MDVMVHRVQTSFVEGDHFATVIKRLLYLDPFLSIKNAVTARKTAFFSVNSLHLSSCHEFLELRVKLFVHVAGHTIHFSRHVVLSFYEQNRL